MYTISVSDCVAFLIRTVALQQVFEVLSTAIFFLNIQHDRQNFNYQDSASAVNMRPVPRR